MKRVLFFFVFGAAFLLSSCAPKVFQPGYCDNLFREQKLIDNVIPENFNFSASALVSGLPVIVNGSFSEEGDSVKISSPFGKTVLTMQKKEGTLCVKMDGFQSCDGDKIISMVSLYIPQAQPFTDMNILKGFVSKKFFLTDSDKYECDGNYLKVLRKDYTLIYQDRSLSQIVYKNYRVEYGLNNQIEVKDGANTLVKINLSSVNFEKK